MSALTGKEKAGDLDLISAFIMRFINCLARFGFFCLVGHSQVYGKLSIIWDARTICSVAIMDAAENAALMYSLLGCCAAQDVNPREWLDRCANPDPILQQQLQS